jgi:hypothetical protein
MILSVDLFAGFKHVNLFNAESSCSTSGLMMGGAIKHTQPQSLQSFSHFKNAFCSSIACLFRLKFLESPFWGWTKVAVTKKQRPSLSLVGHAKQYADGMHIAPESPPSLLGCAAVVSIPWKLDRLPSIGSKMRNCRMCAPL